MISPQPRTQLCFIVQQFGHTIIAHGKRCKGMLNDLAPEHRSENALLINALAQNVAQELLQPPALSVGQHLNQLALHLQDTLGITQKQAYWAVETWALALNVISEPLPKTDATDTTAAETLSEPEPTNPETIYRQAERHYDQGDYAQALPLCQQAATLHHAQGQNLLGLMFHNGYGVAKNDLQAVDWFRKAAEQGDALGQYNLGWMLLNGYGIKKDYRQAVDWFRKAAEQGDASGQNKLGWMYEKGYGVAKDLQQAETWYVKSAAQNHSEAQTNLKNVRKMLAKKNSGCGPWLLGFIVLIVLFRCGQDPSNAPPSGLANQPTTALKNGIVVDNQRGLTWLRFAYGQKWQQNTAVGKAKPLVWEDAMDAVKQFNKKGGYAGYTDWRLPTKAELATLIDTTNSKKGHYINADLFPNSNGTFWSLSLYENDNSHEVWVINFTQGISTFDAKKHSHTVRFVRGLQHG